NRLSFKQFNERVNRLANGLLSMGLRKGDHIGVLLENCHQYLEVYYAASKSGLVAVPLNYRLSEKEVTYVIDHSDSVALVAGKEHTSILGNIRTNLKKVGLYISVESDQADMIPYEEIIESGNPDEPGMEHNTSAADPFWPVKVKEGRVDDILKCSRCQRCYMDLPQI
ncbi:MAG: AMP-binding protein, partial [Proteobacteria bacterium]|nr:AMP-binding protein [Pseudomonadota bacterium]